MNLLFTICGRAGSKGFKNKNLKEFNGYPLSFYTLAAIKGYIDKHPEDNISVALNTDSPELERLIMEQSIVENVISVVRKKSLAGDIAPKVEVIKDTYLNCKQNEKFDVVIDLDITSPMRSVEDIENALEVYKSNTYDLVFSVVESRRSPYFNMVEKKDNGYYGKVCQSNYTARQQAPSVYELNASIYVYSPKFLDSEITGTILDYNCGISVMKDYLVLDIDSEEDFEMMQELHKYYKKNDIDLAGITEIISTGEAGK